MNDEQYEEPYQQPGQVTEVISSKEEIDPNTRQWQLTGLDIIEQIRHRLRGEVYNDDPKAKEEWTKLGKELVNEQGVGELCLFLDTYINKNIILSYFTPEQINIWLIDFEKSLTRKFEYDYEKMGMNIQDVDLVFLMIANTVWAAINRARFGGEKQFLENSEQRRTIYSEINFCNSSK